MYNHSKYKLASQLVPFERELPLVGVSRNQDSYTLVLGDETKTNPCLIDCKHQIKTAIIELKQNIFVHWKKLADLCSTMSAKQCDNEGTLDNYLFLYNIKRAFCFAGNFSELSFVQTALRQLLDLDVSTISTSFLRTFNAIYFRIRMMHKLIMLEMYRIKLISQYMKMAKMAISVSGPWANLDLPEEERMWSYEEDEEYFDQRSKAKKKQTRYNPEYCYEEDGIFFKWVDRNRDPYLFDDKETESPYPSRSSLTIP